jgi:hypothetical protein
MTFGRGRGRGDNKGRGSGDRSNKFVNKSSNTQSDNKPLKKTLADNIHYLGSSKQKADYETTTKFLVLYKEDL